MSEDKGKHYRFEYGGVKMDPYRIFTVYGIADPALQHAIKKILVAGGRGQKDATQDVEEAMQSLNRWQEMQIEDEAYALKESI